MTELKPCPFCGGEAEMIEQPMFGMMLYGAKCNGCGAEAAAKYTEAEAIAAWNTRAERTCRNIGNVRDSEFVCSNCKRKMLTVISAIRYCPSCGAKVVGE